MEHQKIALAIFIASTSLVLIFVNICVLSPIIWKPTPETEYMPIVISYPDSMYRPFYGENASICTVKFLLEYNGTLAENIPVKIVNASCTSYVPYNITVTVGIPQAIRYDLKDTIGNADMIMEWGGTDILSFSDNYVPIVGNPFEPVVNFHVIHPYSTTDIYFPVAGDYSPMILLAPKNDPYNVTLYRFDQIKIHVATETEIESLNINDVNLRFTVAVFVFSWIGYAVLVYELISKVLKKEDDVQIAININISPDNNNPPPVRKTEKVDSFQTKSKSSITKKEANEKIINKKPSKNNTAPT
jgi:hypothetical protein